MNAAVEEADIACATPIAFAEFANKAAWLPDFIVVDEAARLTENMILVVQSKWQHTPCLLIGDTKQFPPLALA